MTRPPEESLQFVQRVLKDWDPLKVLRGCEGPEYEYDDFAPGIIARVRGGASAHELALHLGSLRRESLGAHQDDESDQRIAALIHDYLHQRSS